MKLVPHIAFASLREALYRKQQDAFDVLGTQLGIDARVSQFARALTVVDEHDHYVMVGVLVAQMYMALASEHGYGFEHVARPGCRVYTCLAVRDGVRLVASVQRSFDRNPLPDPGWKLSRWNADEPAKNVETAVAWSRDPRRAHDAGAFPITAPIASSQELARRDVRHEIAELHREIESTGLRDPHRHELRERVTKLVDDHRGLIAGDLARVAESFEIRDGFVDRITILASQLARNTGILASHPIRRLCIRVDRDRAWSQIIESGVLGTIRDLVITGQRLHPRKTLDVDLAALTSCRLDATERLSLEWLGSTDEVVARMLGELDAPVLVAIRLDHADIGPSGLEVLANPSMLPGVVEIDVRSPRGGADEIHRLLRALGSRPRLRALGLGSIPGSDGGIAQTFVHILENASSLVSIALDEQLHDTVLAALAAALDQRAFERVEIDSNWVTAAQIERLIRSPGFAKLGHLKLLVRWELDELREALLATNGHTRIEVMTSGSLDPKLRDHLLLVRARDDGSLDRVTTRGW